MSEVVIFRGLSLDEENSKIIGWNENNIRSIRQAIREQKVVIIKSVITKNRSLSVRNSIINFWKNIKPEVQKNINSSSPNYHRVDDNPEKSAVKMVCHNYVSYYWNNDVCGENNILKAMTKFRNIIACLDEDFTIDSIEGDWITNPMLFHYPPGGGGLNKHADPKTKQFCTILCSLSKKGSDFSEGGAYIEKNEKINLEDELSYGDLFLFDPTIAHGVDPIDPKIDLDWSSRKGRFVLIPALIQVKSLSGFKIEGLKDLETKQT
jgi:hypothetical protein